MTVRLGVAVALLACLLVASAGLAWDIAWHTYIGRDSFLTPPHAVLYGGIVAAGVAGAAGGLLELLRRRRLPLGLLVTGFGILTLVVSAPFDNYWHQLYGIDVTLWAPFHVMGLIGGLVAVFGVVYLLAAEKALMLALFALSACLRGLLTILQPALFHSPTTVLGPFDVLTLPVGLAFSIGLVGAAAAVLAGRRPAATITVAMAAAVAIVFAILAPGVVRWAAAAGGYTFYTPEGPVIQPLDVLVPLGLLVPALILDGVHRLAGSGLAAGVAAALPAAALGIWTVTQSVPVALGAAGLGVAVALVAGAAGGWLGSQLGTVWRLSGAVKVIAVALLATLLALTAAPAWAAATRTDRYPAGPYTVTVEREDPVEVDRTTGFDLMVAPADGAAIVATPFPGPGTPARRGRALTIDAFEPGTYHVSASFPVRGAWFLALDIRGPAGRGAASVPVTVAAPGAIPQWLGWAIGLSPLLGVVAFLGAEVRRARRHSIASA